MNVVPQTPGQFGVILLDGKIEGQAGRGQGFRKTPGFGIGGRQRMERLRPLAAAKLVRALG